MLRNKVNTILLEKYSIEKVINNGSLNNITIILDKITDKDFQNLSLIEGMYKNIEITPWKYNLHIKLEF